MTRPVFLSPSRDYDVGRSRSLSTAGNEAERISFQVGPVHNSVLWCNSAARIPRVGGPCQSRRIWVSKRIARVATCRGTKTKSRHAAKSVTAKCELGCLAGRIRKAVTSKPASINYDPAQAYIRPVAADGSLNGSATDDPTERSSTAGDVPKALDRGGPSRVRRTWTDRATGGGYSD